MSPAKFHDDFDHQISIRNTGVINGPRPSPLKISKVSHVIHKQQQQQQQKQPVIIYVNSPKIIHTQPRDFMALVQKLTGFSGSSKQTMKKKKLKQKMSRDDHDINDSDSFSSSIMKAPTTPFLADMPLFTPTTTDFFCSPSRPMFRFPAETMFASPNTPANPISPSFIEFIKGLPEC